MSVTQEKTIRKFSDFATEELLDGEKIRLENIIGKQIIVLAYKINDSKFTDSRTGHYATIQIDVDGEKKVIFTGSGVLTDQCERYKSEMPYHTVIKKVQKYYTFT